MFFIRLLTSSSDISSMLITGLAFILVVGFSIVMHEVAHGYVALLNGDATAKDKGRLTLDPTVHFNLIGTLMFFLVGFGWAKPVPINPYNFKNRKVGMVTVGFAGVATNIVLACFGLLIFYFVAPLYITTFNNGLTEVLVDLMFNILIFGVQINFMLAMFNLLPIFPLDGFNIVNTLLPNNTKFNDFMIKYGFFVLIGIMLVGNVARAIGVPWLDIFGLFNDAITTLLNKVLHSGILRYYGV